MFHRRRIEPDERVELHLTPPQRDLVVQGTWLPPNLADRLRRGQPKGKDLLFTFSLAELADLAQHIAGAASRVEDISLQVQLDTVYGRIVAVLDRYVEQHETQALPPNFPEGYRLGFDVSRIPEEIREDVLAILNDPNIENVEELAKQLEAFARTLPPEAFEELAGLTPLQVTDLLEASWDAPDGLIRLNRNLTLTDIEAAPHLANAHTLLNAIQDADGINATEAGNLNRRFVDQMLKTMLLPVDYEKDVLSVSKVINELDVFPLHKVRILLEDAKLMSLRSKRFTLTAKGKLLALPEQAGELYARLFETLFRTVNLAYFDRLREAPSIQDGVPFSLYAVARLANDWITVEELAPRILLPFSQFEIDARESDIIGIPYYAYSRILSHLVDFGLLDMRETEGPRRYLKDDAFRKTPLFDRFIQFHIV